MLMAEKSGGKLHDIKETASDAVEIIRELGTPGVQDTFVRIREITITAREIMETMKAPEWQQNIENFRLITDNLNASSERMERTVAQIRETGVINDAKGLMNSAKKRMDSFGEGDGLSSKDLKDVIASVRETIVSVRELVDELKQVAVESKRSGTLKVVGETIGEAYESAKTVREAAKNKA